MNALGKKLGIKANQRLLILNAPEGFVDSLGELPEGSSVDEKPGKGTFDFVQLFARTKAEADKQVPKALKAVERTGMFWGCYPKGSSKIQTDLTRDKGWESVTAAGFEGVAPQSRSTTPGQECDSARASS